MDHSSTPEPEGSDATAKRLLRAASDLLGGDDRLAGRLNISLSLLRMYTTGREALPPHILLRAVDLLIEDRETRLVFPDQTAASAAGATDAADRPE